MSNFENLPNIGVKLDNNPLEGHVWVRDLIYYEGPLVSEFNCPATGETSLWIWCDRDNTHNRWHVTLQSKVAIFNYMAGKCSLLELVEDPNLERFLVDMSKAEDICHRASFSEIPLNYLPTADSFHPEWADEDEKDS